MEIGLNKMSQAFCHATKDLGGYGQFFALFVHLILCATVSKVGIDLLCSCYTGINVSLGSLCTHFLGRREIATFKLLECSVGGRHDIRDVFQVGSVGQQL